MNWEFIAYIASGAHYQEGSPLPWGLAAGLVDEASVRFFRGSKEEARSRYIGAATQTFTLPQEIVNALPDFSHLPSPHWLGLEVEFELVTPWYSRDDRVFHLLDNPVRKDRVFGVPFLAASGWKGMLRWACRLQAGLREHLGKGGCFREGQDPDWILYLFGNEKGEEEHSRQGALVFYPTWFDKIDIEVINPHGREGRAGTQPIYYEVVPGRKPKEDNPDELEEGGKGTLYLLYAPWPGTRPPVPVSEIIPRLIGAIETLLTTYGISSKRTAGWGTAEIVRWKACKSGCHPIQSGSKETFCRELAEWLAEG
ncbi:MAG: RAMP superfamily CRISPR-associated protein [Clostridia bacterium]|jgi:CRISPR-associated protein Cmr2|nr:RAMP superfamily CRISPR-associated protein [Clostridia bacterium]MDH7572758.1 RAMP superfamily CRISPR-associated protein [Clostridia bacterium]